MASEPKVTEAPLTTADAPMGKSPTLYGNDMEKDKPGKFRKQAIENVLEKYYAQEFNAEEAVLIAADKAEREKNKPAAA